MTELLNRANTIGQSIPAVFEVTLNTYVSQRLMQEKKLDEADAGAREMAVRRFLQSEQLLEWQRDAYKRVITSRPMDERLLVLDSLFRATSDEARKLVVTGITGAEEPRTIGDRVEDAASKAGQAIKDIDDWMDTTVAPALEQKSAKWRERMDAVATRVEKRGGKITTKWWLPF